MQIRNAASVFPEPVGAEINVGRRSNMHGQPCSCGSVGVPNRPTNHSCTTGCAHRRPSGIKSGAIWSCCELVAVCIGHSSAIFVTCSPFIGLHDEALYKSLTASESTIYAPCALLKEPEISGGRHISLWARF